ncbi:hypothetical protein [Actinokineospora sp.]|uniref:hypothetical protein n=1 Tax=Actinokineospora sp. TaxID=1872133 RepID=UPI003D6A3D28
MRTTTLPFHATLVHPHTGKPLQAIGYRRDGRPIWPVMGASPDDPSNTDPAGDPPAGDPPTDSPPAADKPPARPADDTDDPVKLKAQIAALRKENGKDRTDAKTKAAELAKAELAQQIGKALGLVKDDEAADPAKLAAQVVESAETARQAQVELAVFKAASPAGADPMKLVDSRSFMAKIGKLDPSADGFGKKVADAVADHIKDNPTSKATPAAPPRSGAPVGGGAPATGRPTSLGAAVGAALSGG